MWLIKEEILKCLDAMMNNVKCDQVSYHESARALRMKRLKNLNRRLFP